MNRRNAITAIATTGLAVLPATLSAKGKMPFLGKKTPVVYVSETGARLDADILASEGTDDTAILQSVLDLVSNKHWTFSGERKENNITLVGDTYNHNCKEQEHHVPNTAEEAAIYGRDKWVFSIESYRIENLNIRDIAIRDQRTFALVIAN